MFDRNKSSKQNTPKKEDARVAPAAPTMSTPTTSSTAVSAVIGSGIEIAGDVNSTSDLVVNGKIQGAIVQSSKSVEIGEAGQVMARVRARLVKISGEVRGDINGEEKVLISRTGKVLGNISAPRVQLDDGALFKGSIDMTPPEAAKPAAPAAEKKPAAPAKPAPATARKEPAASSAAPGSAKPKESDRKEPSLTLKSG